MNNNNIFFIIQGCVIIANIIDIIKMKNTIKNLRDLIYQNVTQNLDHEVDIFSLKNRVDKIEKKRGK